MTDLPCRANPDRQFPNMKSPSQIEAAKRVCNSGAGGRPCPAKDACLAAALPWKVEGVWAGTTEDERDEYRRLHGIKADPLQFGKFHWRADVYGRSA